MEPPVFDAGTILSAAVTTLTTLMGTVVPAAIGLGIVVFGARYGWGLLKSFVH